MKLTTVAGDVVKRVLKDGTVVLANVYTNTLEIDAGDVIIYTWVEK
ncbi:MAG TPA: hypothetical protein PLL71_18275 [Agriterribacter sp.]|nr:hypothetical protein [Agriterribacter sp.]HRQ51309.1 hypothetical protein [Agriterribacter sp.]